MPVRSPGRRTSHRIRSTCSRSSACDRIGEIVERRDDLIAVVAEHDFIVERGQRLVLDDEDSIDDPLALPEQHPDPVGQDQCPRNERSVPQCRAGAPTPPEGAAAARPKPGAAREEGPQRIAKLLARAGVASRRDIERMIAEGRIALNGEKLTTPATLLDNLQGVTVDGQPVKPAGAARLFLLLQAGRQR